MIGVKASIHLHVRCALIGVNPPFLATWSGVPAPLDHPAAKFSPNVVSQPARLVLRTLVVQSEL